MRIDDTIVPGPEIYWLLSTHDKNYYPYAEASFLFFIIFNLLTCIELIKKLIII